MHHAQGIGKETARALGALKVRGANEKGREENIKRKRGNRAKEKRERARNAGGGTHTTGITFKR